MLIYYTLQAIFLACIYITFVQIYDFDLMMSRASSFQRLIQTEVEVRWYRKEGCDVRN